MRLLDPMLMEMEQEAVATRRVLEKVPDDRLDWRPHPRSMSLGQLALHVATTPGNVAAMATLDGLEGLPDFEPPAASSREQILVAHDEGLAQASSLLSAMSDERAAATWTLSAAGRTFMELPRVGLLRAIMLNHWYHHRGQLCVYLRLLDIPVPAVYGRSADESPFAEPAPGRG